MDAFENYFQNPYLWIGGLFLAFLFLYYALKHIPKLITAFILIISAGFYYLPSAIVVFYGFLGRKIDILNYLPDPTRIAPPLNNFYADYLDKIYQPRILPVFLLLAGILLSVDLVKNVSNEQLKQVCRDFCYYLTISMVLASIVGLITGWGILEFLLVALAIATILSLIRATPILLRAIWTVLSYIYAAFALVARYLALISVRMIKAVVYLIEYPLREALERASKIIQDSAARIDRVLVDANTNVKTLLENERLETRKQRRSTNHRKSFTGDKSTTEGQP